MRTEAPETGVHWHIANKVEYVASDPERQNIPWVRSVDRRTGIAEVYTSQAPPSAARPAGEIRTMDCVDCHNRPTHILHSPDQSVDTALADGRIDPSLPFIKQQGVAALTASYASREQAMGGIESSLYGYYQKTYPQIYAGKRQAIDSAIAYLRESYDENFFPAMKVRWDTYATNDRHFESVGCFRCHDGLHKSVQGTVIPSDCDTCHRILRQGKAGSVQFATGAKGLEFAHPVDIGPITASQPCSSCHTGGAM
jgi:hypothetical protein